MNDETQTNASGTPCEQVLDYAYGELSKEQAAVFEQHLQTCAKCQAELSVYQRVRGAVKDALPVVEPPAAATGALHQQLLHAAAQKRPQRGKVLPFARRLVAHPGYAAAAGLLIVGGVVGTQLYRGKLAMPAPSASSVPAASSEVAAAPASPVVTFGGEDPATRAEGAAVAKDEAPARVRPSYKAKLDAPADKLRALTASPSAPELLAKKARAKDGSGADGLAPVFNVKAVPKGGDANGTMYMGDVKSANEKSLAGLSGSSSGAGGAGHGMAPAGLPEPKSNAPIEQQRRAPSERDQPGGYAQPPPASLKSPTLAASPPPPPTTGGPQAQAQTAPSWSSAQGAASPVPAPTATHSAVGSRGSLADDSQKQQQRDSSTLADLKKKALELAQAGQCQAADKFRHAVESRDPRAFSVKESAAFVQCPMVARQLQQSNDILDSFNKAEAGKAAALPEEDLQLGGRSTASKKAKRGIPARKPSPSRVAPADAYQGDPNPAQRNAEPATKTAPASAF